MGRTRKDLCSTEGKSSGAEKGFGGKEQSLNFLMVFIKLSTFFRFDQKMSLVSSLISKVKGGISKAKVVYYVTHIDKYFSQEQIAEGIKVFYQVWDGNIIASAKRFVEVAKANPKLTKAEGEVNVGLLIALFIFILIGIVLLPVITSEVSNLTGGTSPSVTGTNATLLNLVPLFYILVLIIVPAVVVYRMMK